MCGYAVGNSRRNSSAAPRSSWMSTPTKATSAACASAESAKNGNSTRQGGHQEPHWLTTTGCPRRSASLASSASLAPSISLPAWALFSASGFSAFWVAGAPAAPLPEAAPPSPAGCSSPQAANTAATAIGTSAASTLRPGRSPVIPTTTRGRRLRFIGSLNSPPPVGAYGGWGQNTGGGLGRGAGN